MSYSSAHETSYPHPYAFKAGTRLSEGRSALLRCPRVAPLATSAPARPNQPTRRAPTPPIAKNLGYGSQTVCDAIHYFNEHALDALMPGSSCPREVLAAFDESGTEEDE